MKNAHTKAANGLGSIRKRAVKRNNGKTYEYWEGRVTIVSNYNGKQQKTLTAKTQAELIAKMKKAEQAVADEIVFAVQDISQPQAVSSMTLADWMLIWQSEYLTAVKGSTAYLYRRDIELYIIPLLGDYKLTEISPMLVQSFYNRLLNAGDDRTKPLAPKTVRCIRGVLHEAMNQAVANGELKRNPTESCKLPKVIKKEIQPLEDYQVSEFLDAVEGHVHEYLYKIALFTGLRQGELLGLTWDCIDFSKGTLTVKQQVRKAQSKGGEYYFSSTKSSRSRTLSIAPSVLRLFRYQKQKQTYMAAKAGDSWLDQKLVFTNATGGILSYRTVYDCFKRIVRQMGLPQMRFHDLRHSYAVISIKSGDDIKTIQSNLGHSSAAFTLDVYGHCTEEMKKASANRMESYMKVVMKQ